VKVDGTPYRTIWLAADGTTVQDLFDYINAYFAGCP